MPLAESVVSAAFRPAARNSESHYARLHTRPNGRYFEVLKCFLRTKIHTARGSKTWQPKVSVPRPNEG